MRAVLQRVTNASVRVDDRIIASLAKGIVILLGVHREDTIEDAAYLARKCAHVRIFEDEAGKMNLSALEVAAEVLVVSQFTLYGDCRKGRRPSFIDAARPPHSQKCYDIFIEYLRQNGIPVKTGEFGAKMLVEIQNDGPVTLIIDSAVAAPQHAKDFPV